MGDEWSDERRLAWKSLYAAVVYFVNEGMSGKVKVGDTEKQIQKRGWVGGLFYWIAERFGFA